MAGSPQDSLDAHDLAAMLGVAERAVAAQDLLSFAERACEGLFTLFQPCVSVSYNESWAQDAKAAAVIYPGPTPEWFAHYQPIYEQHMHQNPLMRLASAQGGLPVPTDWTQADPQGTFVASELFTQFYAPLGIGNQLVTTIAPSQTSGHFIAFAINREQGVFTVKERSILSTLAPLLAAAHRHVVSAAGHLLPQHGATRQDDAWVPQDALAAVMMKRLIAAGLTVRQSEAIVHAAAGATNSQIGRAMGISSGTVRKHLEYAFKVLGVKSRAGAVAFALSDV